MTGFMAGDSCPSCGTGDSVDLSDGVRLCLSCRAEWRPGDIIDTPADSVSDSASVDEITGDVARILAAGDVVEVLDVHTGATVEVLATVTHLPAPATPPADWAGMFARTPDGALIVVTVDEDGWVEGVEADGTDSGRYAKSHCVYLGDAVDAAGNPIDESASLDTGPMVPAILAVAGLCLTVGLDCVSPEEGGPLTNPRIGWLPPPANEVPEAEQGCAYAVALLVRTFGLDHDDVAKLAASLLTGAEAGTDRETEQ